MRNFFSEQAGKLFSQSLEKTDSDRSAASRLAWESRERGGGSPISDRGVPDFVPFGFEKSYRRLFTAGVAPSDSKAGLKDHTDPGDILTDAIAFKDLIVLPEDKVAYFEVMDMEEPDQKAMLKELGLTNDEALAGIKEAMRTVARSSDSSKQNKTATGEYTAERKAIHQKIADKIVAQGTVAPPGTKPEMLLTGGLPGSGKSTMLKNPAFGDTKRFVKFDSDDIKAKLFAEDCKTRLGTETCPDKLGAKAASYHQETDAVRELIIKQATDERRHFLFDGTLKTLDSAEKMIEKFKGRGYQVKMAFADLPLKKAMGRAINRFLDPEDEGRFVDPAYIASHDRLNIATFEALKSKVSEWHHFSTDVPKGRLAILVGSGKSTSQEKSFELGLDLYKKRRIDPTGRRTADKPREESNHWWAFDDGEDDHLRHTLDYLDEIWPDDMERGREPSASVNKADEVQDCVSAKIAILIREGKEPDQAAAIAYSMCRKDPSAHEKDSQNETDMKKSDADPVKQMGLSGALFPSWAKAKRLSPPDSVLTARSAKALHSETEKAADRSEASRLAWESRKRAADAPADAPSGAHPGHHNAVVGAGFQYQGWESGGDNPEGKSYHYYSHPSGATAEVTGTGTVVRMPGQKAQVFEDTHSPKDMALRLAVFTSNVSESDKNNGEALAANVREAGIRHSKGHKIPTLGTDSVMAHPDGSLEFTMHAYRLGNEDGSNDAESEGKFLQRGSEFLSSAYPNREVTPVRGSRGMFSFKVGPEPKIGKDRSEAARLAWESRKRAGEAPRHLSPAPAERPDKPLPPSDYQPTHLSPAPMTPISGEHSEEADAERAKVVQMQQSQKMVSILTQEDVRRQKREPNIHRLSLFLEALDRAEAHPKGVEAGLRQSFEESPLLNRLLAVVRPKEK